MEVWRLVKRKYMIQLQGHDLMSTKYWLFEFLANATELEATVLAVGCWYIWEARNDARNNRGHPDPTRTSVKILAYIDMIIQQCFKAKPSNRRETDVAPRWSPPPPGVVLVNSDVALFADCRQMAMGAVFRDSEGKCLAAASLPLQGFTSPEMGEALALRGAVMIARDKGFNNVVFVSDCLSLIQRLNSPAPDRSEVGSVVKDIKTLVAGFSTASFRHVKRCLNEAAHILAKTCNLASLDFISISVSECIRKTLCINVC
jgi:hypothetical protein